MLLKITIRINNNHFLETVRVHMFSMLQIITRTILANIFWDRYQNRKLKRAIAVYICVLDSIASRRNLAVPSLRIFGSPLPLPQAMLKATEINRQFERNISSS